MAREIFKNYDIKLSTDPIEHTAGIEIITALIAGDKNVLDVYLSPNDRYLSEVRNDCVRSLKL